MVALALCSLSCFGGNRSPLPGVHWIVIRLWHFLLVFCFIAAAELPRTIPFEFYGNAIWFSARVNGSAPLHFLFDTAAGGCVLNRSRIGELKLPVLAEWDQANAGSGDNLTRITRIPNVPVEFGGVRLAPSRMTAVPLDAVANSYGAAMDGIVGCDLMERFVVRIDYDARTLTLYDPKVCQYDGSGAVVSLEVRNRVPVVRAKVGLPGRWEIEGEFLVDAPYPGVVQFTTPFVRQHDLLAAARRLTPRLLPGEGVGVGGTFAQDTGRIESIQLGPYILKQVAATFANAKAGAFARTDIAGILGGEFLRRFRVTLDYSRKRMILEPSAQFNDPFDADASGMGVKSMGAPYREFTVTRATVGTPAAEAGIQPGDRLLEFAGQPAAELSVWRIRGLLKKPNQAYALKLRRGEETLHVVLKTRRLL